MRKDRREKRCPRHAFEPLVGFLGVSDMGPGEKGGALLSIAAPSMPCEANRPLTSHSEGNSNQTRAKNDPAFTMPTCLLTVTGRCMRRWLHEIGGGCAIRTHSRNFRLSFVKERWYYRTHRAECQWKKSPRQFVVCRGAPLWRNESGFLPITAKSVGVRRCVGLRRCLCRLDGRRHL